VKYEHRKDGRDNCADEPRLMLKVLTYSDATGIFSSRKIARFRHEHLAAFRSLFAQVVQIAREGGLVKMLDVLGACRRLLAARVLWTLGLDWGLDWGLNRK
jgi:hypothetical protein